MANRDIGFVCVEGANPGIFDMSATPPRFLRELPNRNKTKMHEYVYYALYNSGSLYLGGSGSFGDVSKLDMAGNLVWHRDITTRAMNVKTVVKVGTKLLVGNLSGADSGVDYPVILSDVTGIDAATQLTLDGVLLSTAGWSVTSDNRAVVLHTDQSTTHQFIYYDLDTGLESGSRVAVPADFQYSGDYTALLNLGGHTFFIYLSSATTKVKVLKVNPDTMVADWTISEADVLTATAGWTDPITSFPNFTPQRSYYYNPTANIFVIRGQASGNVPLIFDVTDNTPVLAMTNNLTLPTVDFNRLTGGSTGSSNYAFCYTTSSNGWGVVKKTGATTYTVDQTEGHTDPHFFGFRYLETAIPYNIPVKEFAGNITVDSAPSVGHKVYLVNQSSGAIVDSVVTDSNGDYTMYSIDVTNTHAVVADSPDGIKNAQINANLVGV